MQQTCIEPVAKRHAILAQGCWTFGGTQWGGAEEADSLAAMETALELGLTHFDTAYHYGNGLSETLLGRFAQGRRDRLFLASKATHGDPRPEAIMEMVQTSLRRLQTDCIDLYYIHWPRKGLDLRFMMEGLERLRAQGKVGAIGVSNFSVQQMEQVSEVGRIDAHQLCYNALWRFPEREIIPWCRDHGVAVVSYSSIAQGVLSGKFPRQPEFKPDDQRPRTVLFEPEVWPHVYEAVQAMKALAERAGRPLVDLAIQWVAGRPGIASVLVGARTAAQVRQNVAAMTGAIDPELLDEMTALSDAVAPQIPDAGNLFRFYP
jgi:aryl-alcohol dehydrogenase-like predicted oxidoreductase